MNKYLTSFSILLLPSLAQANMGLGSEGFWPLLLNSWLLSAIFLISLILAFFKFFNTKLRRNIVIIINIPVFLISVIFSVIMLRQGADFSDVWWLIIGMLLSHIFSLAIPYFQYKALNQDNV